MDIAAIRDKYFPALNHRDFRLFWTGQCISLIGTWMQNVGQSWLVYQITNSSFKLGLIGALQFLPMLLFSLPMGAIIDRCNKKKMLFTVQFLMMLTAFTLTILVWTGAAAYWNIAILAFILGIINCIDMPVRQSYMVDLATREHLMNAVSLNASIFNAARVIGPGIAGLVFGYFGAEICFLLNGLSFIPVLINIYLIEAEGKSKKKDNKINLIAEISEGIRYIRNNIITDTTVLIIGFFSTLVMNFNIMIPVMTKTVFAGDSKAYGYLMSALGIGAFSGAFFLAATSYKGLRIKLLLGAFLGLGCFVLIEGFQTSYILAFVFFICAGFCMTTGLSSANTSLQLNSPNDLRGRIMSVYSLVLGGSAPIGSLYSGTMCEKLGASNTFRISGILGILFMLYIIATRYRKMIKKTKEKEELAILGKE